MIRLWIKILIILFIVSALLFSVAYLLVFLKGKSMLIAQLENLTKKQVSIGYFGLTPPFNLKVENLEIKGLIKVDSVSVSPSVLGFLTGKIVLNNIGIVRPNFRYERISPLPATAVTAAPAAVSQAAKPKEKQPLRLVFKNINIKEGRIDFIDHTVSEAGMTITVKNIDFHLTNLYLFPFSVITNFELKGRIPWQEGKEEGKISAEGWMNFFKKDMQATLKIEDIDGIYFYPYYSVWVDLEKARIEKADLNFTSNIQGLNNNVVANCRLELTDIVRKPRPPEETQEKAERIADAVLDIFKALNQGKIVLDFTIKTKMDKPQFGFLDIKMAFEDKIAQGKKSAGISVGDVLGLPAKVMEGTVKSATDVSKAVIEGTFAVGNELKKAVEAAFTKEKKE